MVHRSADARLLSNLVSHEKDYSKQLQALLTASQSSLGSLTAYAAASPPATSRTILNVAAILAAADGAHQRYASAVEEWRDMLRGLHALEEEVANVIRDREILVTRLIKASKSSTKSASSSTSHLRSPSGSSLNLNAIPGTSTKLAAAQSELQACETHLATKERELDVRRVQVIRDGLILRGRALSDVGWTWSELGREAINTVENELGVRNEPHQHQQPHQQRSEDHRSPGTSISTHASSSFPGGYPNTSSSEDGGGKAGEINIPAAHAISSEIDMPIPFMNSATNTPSRRNSTLSPRNSMSMPGQVLPPPVPSKRNSFLAMKSNTPRHSRLVEPSDLQQPQQQASALQNRPHLQHVAPNGRASWASVTDTEEDWADAGEGGEELDAVFGRPSSTSTKPNAANSIPPSHSMSSNKDLPSPPPIATPFVKYPFAQAPGSVFDSEAYKGAREELSSRPTSMTFSSDGAAPPPPVIRVSSGGHLDVPQPRSGSLDHGRDEDGLDVESGRRSMATTYSNRTSEASEVEYVGKATRYRFAVEDPTVLSAVPASPVGVSGGSQAAVDASEAGVEDVDGEDEKEEETEEGAPPPVGTTAAPLESMSTTEEAAPKLTKRAKKKQRRKEKGKQRMTEQQELEEQQRRMEEEAAGVAEEAEVTGEGTGEDEEEEVEVVQVKHKAEEKVVEVVEVTQVVVPEHRGVLVAAPLAAEVQPASQEVAEVEEEKSLDEDEEDRLVREGLLTVVENPRFAAPAAAPTAAAPATAAPSTGVSAPAPVAETHQPAPAAVATTEESVVVGEGKETGGKKKEKRRSVMAALFHPMGGAGTKVEQKEGAAVKEEGQVEAAEEPVALGEVEAAPAGTAAAVPVNGTGTEGVPSTYTVVSNVPPPPVPIESAVSAPAVSSLGTMTPVPPPQRRSMFGRLFGRGRSGSVSKDKAGEQVLNEVPPPVPSVPAAATGVAAAPEVAAAAAVPAPAPVPAPSVPASATGTAVVPEAAATLPAPAPAPAPSVPAPAPVPAPVPAATETTTTTVVEETIVAAQPAVPIVQQAPVVAATPAPAPVPAPSMPEPVPFVPQHAAVPPASTQAPIVQPQVVASAPPAPLPAQTTPAPVTKSKLSKKKTIAPEESPTKTHSHGGFFGAFRKKKGEESVPVPQRTATETVWVQPEPQPEVAAVLPPAPASNVQVAEGAGGGTGSFVSTGSGSAKHQRRASRGGTLSALFGLNHHHRDGQPKKLHQHHHHVLTKGGERSDGEEGGVEGAEGPQYQVYVNEEDLETRRERLRMQHEAGAYHQHQYEGSPVRGAQQARVERRNLAQPGHQHHVRSQSEGVVATRTNQQEDLGAYRSTSPVPQLVGVQAPGPVNLEEIQAQARSTSGGASTGWVGGGWSTRTEKNMRELQSDSWRDGQLTHMAVPGGGAGRAIPQQFEPVILPDLSDRALRGVEAVHRPAPQGPTTHPMEYAARYGGGGGGAGLERNASVSTSGPGRAGGKLKKGRSSSVPPESDTAPRPYVATAPPSQAERLRPFPGGQHRKEVSEEVGSGVQRESVKPRRSTSLTTGTPRVVSQPSQNQYGATVLVTGGDVSGQLAKGGWGANQGASLSRNTSVKSNATAPVGGRYTRVPKTQAHSSLGQGMPSSALGTSTPPRRTSGGPYPFYGGSQSMVDITPISGPGSGAKTAKTEKRTTVPYPMSNVPGAVTGVMPMTVPRAPLPTSSLVQGGWPGSDNVGGGLVLGASGATSLLSIVEDVARGNRQAEERMRVLKGNGVMDTEVVQAPTRVHREMLTGPGGAAAVGYKPSSASGGSTTSLSQGSGLGRRASTRPAQSPLKSALRHPSTSRTPSPSNVHRRESVNAPVGASGGRFVHRAEDGNDEEAYESAYETPGEISGDERGRKMSDVKGKGPIQTPAPPPVATYPSDATITAPTPSEAPQRKKSVRVSLQPTFSTTPPAIYDDDEDQRMFWPPVVPDKPVRNKSRFLQGGDGLYSSPGASTSAGPRRVASTSKAAPRDVWQDSDDEDEEYMKARMRLSRALEEERQVYATARATAAF
ncbi:hypothetical protein MD484_g6855, partial [Candolleomyces efflorescens]